MATLHQVQAGLQQVVSAALVGLVPGPAIGIGWPSEAVLANNVRPGAPGLVSVYDRKMAKDSTRWKATSLSQVVTPATLVSTVSQSTGPSPTITLSSVPSIGDAVSCVATWDGAQAAQVVVATAGATANGMATALANAINADPVLGAWFSATASGPVLALTPRVGPPWPTVASYTGNGGSEVIELGRRDRQMQVVVWANSELQRQSIGDPIETLIVQLEAGYGAYPQGLPLADGTSARVLAGSDFYLEDSTLFDLYRRDFLLSLDYPLTTTDALYAVVAPVLATTPNQL